MRIALLAGAGLLALGTLRAEIDPPSRVARLNYISGSVAFQPAGLDDWVDAPINRPITTGDHLWAGEQSRAELHIGSTAIRAGGATGFSFLNLDDKSVQIRLEQGSLQIRLRRLEDDATFEIDTPNLAFSLLRPGTYRLDVNANGDATIVTVRGGDGEGTGGNQAFPLHVRQQARVSGADTMTFDVGGAPPPDNWDNWCDSRDRREDQAQSAKYVSREMIGYEDLDEYGGWRPVPEYGMVWYPRTVASGWAPYHNGHWTWIDPWGWTWVDDAPWGFAPFHYGRWVYAGGGWGWIPGPVAARPVYAPALVAWVGGAHFSLSVSVGGARAGVAWFPLGPGDVYVPAHHASQRYFTTVNSANTTVNNVNITKIYNTTVINNNTTVINNNTNVTEIKYVNRNAPGAVTAVPQEAFVRSRPVAQAAVAAPQNLQAAPTGYAAPVAPARQSVLGAGAPAAQAARPPAAAMNRAVVAKTAPPPRPVPFAMKQEALQANPGHPVAPEAARELERKSNADNRPLIRQAPAVRASQPAAAPNPRMAQPATAATNPPSAQPAAAPNPRMAQPAATGTYPPVAQPAAAPNPHIGQPAAAGTYPSVAQPAAAPNPHIGQPAAAPNPRIAQPASAYPPIAQPAAQPRTAAPEHPPQPAMPAQSGSHQTALPAHPPEPAVMAPREHPAPIAPQPRSPEAIRPQDRAHENAAKPPHDAAHPEPANREFHGERPQPKPAVERPAEKKKPDPKHENADQKHENKDERKDR